ncbi:hypothetical protein ACHAWF_017187, partial [Thalassiosira exigua]
GRDRRSAAAGPGRRSSRSTFDDFSAFLDACAAACECLRTREDARRPVLEVAEDLKRCGAIYAEVALSHTFYARRFGSAEATPEVLAEAASEAEARTGGVAMSYVLGAERRLGVEAAVETARLARTGAERTIRGRPGRGGVRPPRPGGRSSPRALRGGVPRRLRRREARLAPPRRRGRSLPGRRSRERSRRGSNPGREEDRARDLGKGPCGCCGSGTSFLTSASRRTSCSKSSRRSRIIP